MARKVRDEPDGEGAEGRSPAVGRTARGIEIAADSVLVRRNGGSVVLDEADEIDAETGLPLAKLRALIQEGLDSGPSEPLDMERVKRLPARRMLANRWWR
ncbi:hypothetical protein AB5I41_02735 [Sphingomonas sp. MMS24-JH45]